MKLCVAFAVLVVRLPAGFALFPVTVVLSPVTFGSPSRPRAGSIDQVAQTKKKGPSITVATKPRAKKGKVFSNQHHVACHIFEYLPMYAHF